MNLQQLTDEVNNIYFNDTSSYKTIASKQKELLAIVGANTDIKKINRELILKYFNTLKRIGNKANTINSKMAYLSKILTYAVANRLIEFKPVIPYIKEKHTKTKIIKPDEYTMMLDYTIQNKLTELNQVIIIGYNTGMRISNILAMQADDIENNYIRIYNNKTNNPYSIPINKNLQELLKDFKGFTLNYRQIQYQFQTMIKRLNLDSRITIHTLRHTTCTRLVEKGIAIPTIQKIMNHKNISTTMQYTHISDEQLEQAVAVL